MNETNGMQMSGSPMGNATVRRPYWIHRHWHDFIRCQGPADSSYYRLDQRLAPGVLGQLCQEGWPEVQRQALRWGASGKQRGAQKQSPGPPAARSISSGPGTFLHSLPVDLKRTLTAGPIRSQGPSGSERNTMGSCRDSKPQCQCFLSYFPRSPIFEILGF